MIRRPPRSTLFPTRRSSDLAHVHVVHGPQLPGRHDVGPLEWGVLLLSELARGEAEAAGGAEGQEEAIPLLRGPQAADRKSTRLNSSHSQISYAVFCLKKKKK